MSAKAFSLKCLSAVIVGNKFELKQLFSLKIETMNESWVKFWRVFLGKILGVSSFRLIKRLLGLRRLG